jgi:gas vesicle protein
MKTTGKIITAAAAGIAAGAIAGLLLAPKSGKETRNLLQKKGNKLTDKMKDGVEEGKKAVSGIREKIEESLKDVNHKVGEVV